MGRKHLLPVEHDEYLERIGLTNFDKKVYISTLDSGLVSVGEIQQLTVQLKSRIHLAQIPNGSHSFEVEKSKAVAYLKS